MMNTSDSDKVVVDAQNEHQSNGDTHSAHSSRKSSRESLPERRRFANSLSIPSGASGDRLNVDGQDSGPSTSDQPATQLQRRRLVSSPSPSVERELGSSDMEEQSQQVVLSFLLTAHERDLRHQTGEMHNDTSCNNLQALQLTTPTIPAFNVAQPNPLSAATQVGARLAQLGDEFQRLYGPQLDEMVQLVLPSILEQATVSTKLSEAYAKFSAVARNLFKDGIRWGAIIALLAFGYRMAVALFRNGVTDLMGLVSDYLVKFLLGERIAKWILDNGGWGAGMNYRFDEGATGMFGTVLNNFYFVLTATAVLIFLTNALTTRHK